MHIDPTILFKIADSDYPLHSEGPQQIVVKKSSNGHQGTASRRSSGEKASG